MKSRNAWLLCFLLLMIAVVPVACKSSSDSGTSESPSLAMKGTSGNAVNMNGTWKSCVHSTTDQTDDLDTATFSGSSATFSAAIWSAATTANWILLWLMITDSWNQLMSYCTRKKHRFTLGKVTTSLL